MSGNLEVITPHALDQAAELSSQLNEQIIIVREAAASLALGETVVPYPETTDISLSADAYRHLRRQEEWQPVIDREPGWLQKGTICVKVGPGWRTTHQDLQSRAWQHTWKGKPLDIAGLPDIYADDQARAGLADTKLGAAIRHRLDNPDADPLPRPVLAKTIQTLGSIYDTYSNLSQLEEFEQALLVAADGVYSAATLLGDEDVGRANRIYGILERGVPYAYYHNATGTRDSLKRTLIHGRLSGMSAHDILIGSIGALVADRKYGNGRRKNNQTAYDEKVSADISYSRARRVDLAQTLAETLYKCILFTSFSEEGKQQRGRLHPHPAIRMVCSDDLTTITLPTGAKDVVALAFEDRMSLRKSGNTVLAFLYHEYVKQYGFRDLGAAEDMAAFLDESDHLDRPVGPHHATARHVIANDLRGNGNFQRVGTPVSHVFPEDWTFQDDRIRNHNSDTLEKAADILALEKGTISDVITHIKNRQLLPPADSTLTLLY